MQEDRSESSEQALWERMREHADQEARTALIEKHAELARKVAASLYARRIDDSVEFEEYHQFGLVGLIESVDRFQPGRNVAFETFASYRIRGAILNGLQKTTERRDQIAYRARRRRERLESLKKHGQGKETLFEEMVELTLGLAIGYMLEDTRLIVDDERIDSDRAYRSSELQELKRQLAEAVEELPERERMIIQYHYFQATSFENLAATLGLTRGRISQLHKRALEMVRERIAGKSLDDYF